MSLEQTVDNLEIRYANAVTFVGTSNTMIDTTTGRIQTKGIQHNSNVITDISGPHGRGAATLKKYPEIIFEEGKFDRNDTTNTYVQAGYTVTASSVLSSDYHAWRIFDDYLSGNDGWATPSRYNASSPGEAQSGLGAIQFPAASGRYGEYVDLQLPHGIKVKHFVIKTRPTQSGSGVWMPEDSPGAGYLYGSNNGTTWIEIKAFSGLTYGGPSTNGGTQETVQVDSTTAYRYLRLQATNRAGQNGSDQFLAIGALEYYGYEEDPPAGDHSVDTTFMSRFNNPHTTGVQVLVDGATGVGTNQISGGPDPSGNQSTYVTDGKYWTLNGTLTSNLSVEANTFLEGDQPHAVSVWFNSSNLEANVSNTCVFSVSDQEHLNSQNLDLQSNTWHNLTYAYQGEGGSRVTYLDGRKVAEDQAEDTFGLYPPFDMTGYSQGGYVASASSNYSSGTPGSELRDFGAFNAAGTSYGQAWLSGNGNYSSVNGTYTSSPQKQHHTGSAYGEWLQIEMPHRIKVNYFILQGRPESANGNQGLYSCFKNAEIWGSVDGINWNSVVSSATFGTFTPSTLTQQHTITVNSTSSYKYFAIIVTNTNAQNTNGGLTYAGIGQWQIFGHRENDLVRLPDPTNVLKYPHIAMTGPAQRGYVAEQTNYSGFADGYSYRLFDDSDGQYQSASVYSSGVAGGSTPTTTATDSSTHQGVHITLTLPHKMQLQSVKFKSHTYYARTPASGTFLGSNDNSTWDVIGTFSGIETTSAGQIHSVNIANYASKSYYKYIRLVVTHTSYSVNSSATGLGGLLEFRRLEYYGTEEATPVPIQIGGGNIDKVANFRVYDKFIDENQALEIWDAQKDEFERAKSSMTLQKGRLGIGTTEPRAALDVRGNILGGSPAAFSVAYNPTSLSGNQTIIWNLVYHNIGGGYNSSSGLFTAPVSGYYHFTVWGMTSGSTSGVIEFQFRKNGSTVQQRPYGQAGSNYGNATGTIIEYLSVGDTMSIFLTNSATMYASSAQSYNGFSGFYLSN